MNKKYFSLLLYFLVLALFASCRQDEGSPIRNVKFDPNLLNQVQAGSACNTYNYFYDGQQQTLGSVYTRQVLVAFASGTSVDEQKRAIEQYGFVKSIGSPTSFSSSMLYVLPLVEGLNCSQTERALEILNKDKAVAYAGPYFVRQSNLLGVSNEVIVTVQNNSKGVMDRLLKRYGASLVERLAPDVYVVKVDKGSAASALELANLLHGERGIAHAEPNFVISELPADKPVPVRERFEAGVTGR